MEKKISLSIRDIRDSFGHLNQKKPYYLYIQFGAKSFAFSNKKKAERWLTKFENEVTLILHDLMKHFPTLYELHVSQTKHISLPEVKDLRDSMEFYMDRYWRLLNLKTDSIGREINGIYYEIERQYKFHLRYLRTNNRQRFLYERTRLNLRNLKRIRNDIDVLFNQVEGLKSLEVKFLEPEVFDRHLKIV